MTLLLAICMGLASAAPPNPNDPAAVAAEAFRITQEIRKYAAEGKDAGVEREYRNLLGLGLAVDPAMHVMAANVAQDRGDSLLALARLQRVPDGARVAGDALEAFERLFERYGYVRISARVGASVEGPSSFAPAEAKAVARVAEVVAKQGSYLGLLPAGDYRIDGQPVQVPAGKTVSVIVAPQL